MQKLVQDGRTMNLQKGEPSSHRVLSYADDIAVLWQDFLLLVGRVMIAWIFLQSGWGKLFNIAGVGKTFPQRGLPEWMAYISVPTEFFGGLFLLLGFATRYTALVMLIFTIVATFSSHAYWSSPEAQRINQETHFWKNVSIMGGFIVLFVRAAGRFSFDSWLSKRR
jgi:putative oxidoreductase